MNTQDMKGLIWGLLLVPTLLAHKVQAQGFVIDWFTIDGGGGTSTGGVYSVSGTVSQPDAGTLLGGMYQVEGGFWSARVIQMPGAPRLTITRASNGVIVSWPRPATGFLLDSSTSPGPVANWGQVPLPYQSNATDIFITVPAPVGNQFYRLRKSN